MKDIETALKTNRHIWLMILSGVGDISDVANVPDIHHANPKAVELTARTTSPFLQLAVIGVKQSGKSTAAGMFDKCLRITPVDTSDEIYRLLAVERGITIDAVRKLPKEEIRPDLIRVGDKLTHGDPLAIIPPHLMDGKTSFAVAGIRTPDQLIALRDKFPQLLVIWINRDNHDPGGVDNLALSEADADLSVRNNGVSMAKYEHRLMRGLYEYLRAHR